MMNGLCSHFAGWGCFLCWLCWSSPEAFWVRVRFFDLRVIDFSYRSLLERLQGKFHNLGHLIMQFCWCLSNWNGGKWGCRLLFFMLALICNEMGRLDWVTVVFGQLVWIWAVLLGRLWAECNIHLPASLDLNNVALKFIILVFFRHNPINIKNVTEH